MTLQEHISTLSNNKQFCIAIRCIKLALPIWENYANRNELTYRDSVVGLSHSVDISLLTRTVNAVHQYLSSNRKKDILFKLRERFDDPIVALQDRDWKLPDEVQKTFYSVFNLLEACLGNLESSFGELTIYISINQAVDALDISKIVTPEEIKDMLYERENGR